MKKISLERIQEVIAEERSGFKTTIFNYTESFKFNKVVSEFMILLNNNKNKKLTKKCKEELISLLKIYMPSLNYST